MQPIIKVHAGLPVIKTRDYDNRNAIASAKLRYQLSTKTEQIAYPVTMMRERIWIEERLVEIGRQKKDLAEAMNLERSRISEIIAGKRDLKATEALRLAQFLGLDIAAVLRTLAGDIANPADDGPAPPGSSHFPAEKLDEEALLRLWKELQALYARLNVGLKEEDRIRQLTRSYNLWRLNEDSGLSADDALTASMNALRASLKSYYSDTG